MSEVERFATPKIGRLQSALWQAEEDARRLRNELRAAEGARILELEAAHPEALYPCGRSHACRSCSPNRVVPGPGCLNCRQTGCDQTPCLACRDALAVKEAAR